MLLARDSIVGISIPSSISLPASLFNRSVIHHPATNSLVAMLARLIVGERSRILKFSTHHQDQSKESSSNEGEGSASTYLADR